LNRHPFAVVSTIGPNGFPQSAVVEFSQNKSLDIFFDTFRDSRKYRNLKANGQVSLVIGADEGKTLQRRVLQLS